MRRVHRVVNSVGYKRIYPLISEGDHSICQYCGRTGSIELQITDDHVPPLNVKIPSEYINEVRKCLVRACSECNSLASDIPHMDFWERHYWLKSAYIRRYHKLIISEGSKYADKTIQTGHLKILLDNYDIQYNNVLLAIGFGLKDINEVDSPFLKMKTKGGKSVKALIIEHVHGIPEDDEEDDEDLQRINSHEVDFEKQMVHLNDEQDYFVDFVRAEILSGNFIDSASSYKEWCEKHPSRFASLGLPDDPITELKITWMDIIGRVNKMNCKNIEDQQRFFIDFIRSEMLLGYVIDSAASYQEWRVVNMSRFVFLGLPNDPTIELSITWDDIFERVNKLR